MDQKTLREFEWRCIQEEPPFCQTACPIHVDVRGLTRHMSRGEVQAARKVLARIMPLPGVLGLICDHPCERKCRRADVGQAIRIGELERACIRNSQDIGGIPPLPRREEQVSVLGGGFSSLSLAWDLARKGFGVDLFADRIGGSLLVLPEERLPRQALEAEMTKMIGMGVSVHGIRALTADLLDTLLAESSAVYLGLDDLLPNEPLLDFSILGLELELGLPRVDLVSLATSRRGVYCGGWQERELSPVNMALHGRKVALSIERQIQGASLTAAREKEGPYLTRQDTSIEGVTVRPAVPMAVSTGYLPDEARAEAVRCLQCDCMRCVDVCPYLERYKAWPKRYAREIYNNLSVVHGQRQSNTMINSCSWCRLCEYVCPHDFSMAELTGLARREMVTAKKMPPSAHDFALRDYAFSTSSRASLARLEPGKDACNHLFFPGCQLSGSSPRHVKMVYDFLRSRLDGGVGLMLDCCGAPPRWAGREDLLTPNAERIRETWDSFGRPRLVLACSTCAMIFADILPQVESISLWQVLDEETGLPEEARADKDIFFLHDPCTTRDLPAFRESVRNLLARVGLKIEEPSLTAELTECCGYGGLMDCANPEMAREQAARRAARSEKARILVYCAICRDELARGDKKVAHLLDVLFPGSQYPQSTEPLVRTGRGMADRQENRARLRAALLDQIWSEDMAREPWETLRLALDPETQELVDKRRILSDDLRRAIYHAEEHGNRLVDPATGRYVCMHKPGAVTYWVEYTSLPDDPGCFRVHRAWSHRMQLEAD
ncbi:pyridine nucleotide-disulfide oxidoreductase/dicluster-binding protein [Desulfofustis glycolicus]|uniref:Cysteine-rich domain-containing protein n=1 Tax=Desulfofustis glycolicus DSM 9705 TaxID=1121409 RepID=A0A1M5YHQ1_9BACT|nr:pyridine nucleotide-disulfide oxidoreductase/dicluster-binding protein [Desulfofustis glycolicus]SHI11557.1 Cysteine-rich domain-containing protein [Desulfofustis glycolicus DSM 9705]